ncbi:hypothetical protein PSHT_12960 [Puccinia striiformis]|uniref:Uncharacterized protein n=2 Tax=Puccinia striiformis TaxID=27350 RepID=A0A2S4VU70_9BASI|nr:hypothetical protein PSHT_12960 [Puccinia striiformis]POW13030.1 hypothetical protein PSTT_03995 [Puccinia striiformis]
MGISKAFESSINCFENGSGFDGYFPSICKHRQPFCKPSLRLLDFHTCKLSGAVEPQEERLEKTRNLKFFKSNWWG